MFILGLLDILGGLFGTVVAIIIAIIPSLFGMGSMHGMFPQGWPHLPGMSAGHTLFGAVAVLVVLWMLFWLASSVVICVGGWRMWHLRGRRTAFAAAVIIILQGLIGLLFSAHAAFLLTGTWSLLKLAAGVLTLVALLRPDGKKEFAERAQLPNQSGNLGSLPPERSNAELARKQVAVPATGLMLASGLNLFLFGALLALAVLGLRWHSSGGADTLSANVGGFNYSRSTSPGTGMVPWWLIASPVLFVVVICPGLVTFFGAWRMRQLRSFGLATVGAILAILTPPGLILGVIFGIWALVVLSREKVRAAFQAGNPLPSAQKPDRFWRWFAITIVALISIPTFLAIFGVGAAMLIPAFVKVRRQEQAQLNAVRASVALEQAKAEERAYADFSFGPITECVLPYEGEGTPGLHMIGFRSGQVLTPSEDSLAGGGKNPLVDWMNRNWADAVAELNTDGSSRLFGFQQCRFESIANGAWADLPATALIASWSSMKNEVASSSVTSNSLPMTLLFKTRDATGVLQITGFTENPRGVRLRYKLLQNSASAPSLPPGYTPGQSVPLPPAGYPEEPEIPLPPAYVQPTAPTPPSYVPPVIPASPTPPTPPTPAAAPIAPSLNYQWYNGTNIPAHVAPQFTPNEPELGSSTSRAGQIPQATFTNGFGPLIERVITLGEVRPDGLVFVNLEKNEVMQPPFSVPVNWAEPTIFKRGTPLDAWIAASGMDVALHLGAINWGLVPVGTQLITHSNYAGAVDFLNGIKLDDARALLTDPNARKGHYASLGTHVSGYPVSSGYIFKTRRDVCGLLQVAGFTNGTPRVLLRYRLAQNEIPAAPSQSTPSIDTDLKVRLSAAERILSFSERDTALAAVARDAAKAGNPLRAQQAVAKMTSFSERDAAAVKAARELAKNGYRAEAVDIAKTITSFSTRDSALKELAQ